MKSTSRGRHNPHLVLTEIEKLDGLYEGLAFSVKAWFDQGVPTKEIPKKLHQLYGVSVTDSKVETFRCKRYVPEKEFRALKVVVAKVAIEAFGGDAGLDAVILSKLWEMMDKMTIPQLIAARTLFVKVRAQSLKEQEFLYKSGQLRLGPGGAEVPDAHTQQKNVLRRIKEIFGITTDDEEGKPPELAAAAPEAASEKNTPERLSQGCTEKV